MSKLGDEIVNSSSRIKLIASRREMRFKGQRSAAIGAKTSNEEWLFEISTQQNVFWARWVGWKAKLGDNGVETNFEVFIGIVTILL